MVANVADQQRAATIKCNRVGLLELRLSGRSAITAESRLAGTSHCCDYTGFLVNAPHHMIRHVNKEQIACFVESDLIGLVDLGLGRRTSVSAIALLARAHYRRYLFALEIEPAHGVVIDVAEV